MHFFAKFVVREGTEAAAETALREVLAPSREEPGCVHIEAYRALRGGRVFYIHSVWKDEAAFDHHASLPHTQKFIDRMKDLLEHGFDMTRTDPIA